MKNIGSGNEALASAKYHVLERKKMPEAGIFLPQYSAINQVYREVGGNATISYMDVLARSSLKIMNEQQLQYDRMERNQAIDETDQAFAEAEREYLANNASGKGYTEFVTDTYTKLYKEAIDNASNSNVKNELQLFFENKKTKLTHNAFNAEQQMYSAYVLNETEPRINSIMNSAVKHPEQYDILKEQLEIYLEPLQGTVSANTYEKIVSEKNKDLIYSVGLGQIDQNPTQGLALLEGEAFKSLPEEKYLHLQKYANSAVKEQERQARREEREAEHLQAIMRQQIVDQYKLSLARNDPGTIAQIEKDERISEHERSLLLISAAKKNKNDDRVNDIRKTLDDALWGVDAEIRGKKISKYALPKGNIETINLNDITPKEIDDYYSNILKVRNKLNSQNLEEPLSLAQKVDIGKQISRVYAGNLKSLKLEISNNIRNSQNAKEILDACISLYGNENLPAIDGIDADIRHFARLAINLYKGNENEQKLIEKRDAWLKVDKETLERNKLAWKESKYGSNETRTGAFKDLYKKAGYKSLWWDTVFGSLEEQAIRNKVEPILKDAFLKSGNQAEAEVIAIDYMHSFVKNSDINGKTQPMINPPTEENTGYTEATINKQINKIKEDIIKFYRTEKKKNLSFGDIKIEAVSVDEPIYNFYYMEDGLKIYCVDRGKDNNAPETRTVYWPNQKRKK